MVQTESSSPSLSPLHEKMEQAHINQLDRERRDARIMMRWLKGYDIDYIARCEGSIDKRAVISAIERKRKEIAEITKADIEELIAERIAGLKVIKAEAFDYMEMFPEKAPQLLTVALRAEETQAKIQGVLSEKVMHLGRIQHDVKHYDFTDRTPPMVLEHEPKPDIHIAEPELPILEEYIEMRTEGLSEIVQPISVVAGYPPKVPKPVKVNIVNGVVIVRPGDTDFGGE